jgi:hypothetical protein
MSPMSAFVQAPDGVMLWRAWFLGQEKPGDRPDGVKLGFAVHEMVEIRRHFQMRDDGPEGVMREIPDSHDISGINSILDPCAVSF